MSDSTRPAKKARLRGDCEPTQSIQAERPPRNGAYSPATSSPSEPAAPDTLLPTGTNDTAPDSLISHASAIDYWTGTEASVTGMLGGYPQVSRIDLQQSSSFLGKLRRSSTAFPPGAKLARAVDCGAGIGRITLGLLSKAAAVVDVVEPVEKFTKRITDGDEFADVRARGGIGRVWNVGLEAWDGAPDEYGYQLIWNQWCLGQLTDAQVRAYLRRLQGVVVRGGWIVIKENLSNDPRGVDVFDETDSSVTRTDEKFRTLFEEAGLRIVSTEMQRGFPKGLYPVRVYALQPAD